MNRQRIVLACLLGVLAISLVYAYLAVPRQEFAPPRPAAAPTKAGTAPQGKQPVARLHLELLESDPQPYPGTGRDIFQLRRAVPPQVVVAATPQPVAPPPPPPPTAEELLRRELAGYKVLGFLEKGGERSVFLTNGGEVFVVKGGQPFGPGRRFVAAAITASELVIRSADGAVTVRLPLSDSHDREPAIIAPVSVPRPGVDVESSRPVPASPGRRVRPGAPPPAEEPPGEESAPGNGAVDLEQP